MSYWETWKGPGYCGPWLSVWVNVKRFRVRPVTPDHVLLCMQSAILSAQSAANVRKESLCQPALEVLETSSQESSLESETDEDDDFMDV